MILKNSITEFNGNQYVVCKRVCEQIGLSIGQYHNEFKRIKKDPLLKNYFVQIKIKTNGGLQTMVCLNIKCLGIWLTKINLKSLSEKQYKNILVIINYTLTSDFNVYKTQTNIYDFESELRDEIYNLGYFNDFKVIDKEVIYDFGRIDLLCTNDKNERICIELKKFKAFDDTKEQLLRYLNSNIFAEVIYCSYMIECDFEDWCKENDISIYTYSRQLNIKKSEAI